MTPWTRRLSMPIAALVLVAGCSVAVAVPASPAPPPVSLATTPGPTPRPAPSAAPTQATAPTQARIDDLSARIAADPTDAGAQRDLGLAIAQRIRETADPSLYAPAETAFSAALELEPDDILAIVGLGGLQLGRHQFAAALETGEAATAAFPDYPPARGVVVDALIELGRYDEASDAATQMALLGEDLPSLARLSYVQELHGDLPGALARMRAAAAAPGLAPENTAYVTALVGNLEVATGDPGAAAASYEAALALVPGHAPSIAGLGRLAVGRGDLDEARRQFERAAAILPLPEYVIALGEVQAAAGDQAAADASFDLARAEIGLFEASGVVVDQELALFEADHGDPARALELATAAAEAAPTVRSADAVAWALHRLGRNEEAATRSREALRLGSMDPLLRYHAGAIAAALGRTDDARRDLELALTTDPGFSAAGAAEARRLLDTLP